jgi:hypothetical protein
MNSSNNIDRKKYNEIEWFDSNKSKTIPTTRI